ncbi:MAG: 5-carboxymethyl-2-hydroxymuconate isomerase [Pseudoalteromonas rhizosphaerae]|jgi:5-carboxymethyl-2-hydroxymuconate isomerase|uniref:5-carboxymethyl-2-hydroxymuconate Delta-isomerase n=2 Tax=Pseudoalteromonas TaxID=53246 RepID=A0ABY3FGB4_9GAMM|nr:MULTISPECIES: 5-carboxymethyl-2-hydroxymuconate Delta-isomerase [Pseudoalteromonas]MBB1293818.1 5-carboxymethyl-2-hydroxymuconate Delta-isomerase [Pseudoalteromonas sp. SR41-4]MBB1309628.1 5-carboxymethyl-2-hydroxymuconate Delta-isomerase [Pseudoalteromonas sp. SR41-8]MBB1341701.1 5-carboxymethyl-2-hydroxymuconate Delta-isomerase [Pseudoalteromonas sp. SR45-6]MBB1396965.1 5-carboxymethyl-2-hydroxymuconate Delta-isomerase [Pseudoalteromonas sp. SG44-8]MBB1408511.1 5-carboxymethyl-2-hydroxymu
MPHIIIEHSEDLPVLPQVLVEKIHQATFNSGLFELATIKTRAIAYTHYQLGDGKEGFIHIGAHIMQGRTIKQKQQLSEQLLDCLKIYCRESDSLSVNVHDMEHEIYRKC